MYRCCLAKGTSKIACRDFLNALIESFFFMVSRLTTTKSEEFMKSRNMKAVNTMDGVMIRLTPRQLIAHPCITRVLPSPVGRLNGPTKFSLRMILTIAAICQAFGCSHSNRYCNIWVTACVVWACSLFSACSATLFNRPRSEKSVLVQLFVGSEKDSIHRLRLMVKPNED